MKLSRVTLISILFCLSGFMTAQNISPEIINGFKNGNITQIQEYFAETLTIDIKVLGINKSNVKKAQAIEELKKFFEAYSTIDFKIIHTGERNNSSYAIGKLITNEGEYRITIFFKKISEQYLIDQIKIEASN
ncbi:MAG: DUF4783 domain-containing protein [Candidatus Azobacteroides sp.]|nr:DUF4783 domain-containing protein [Candidatus Azobacteroides sp.]